MKLEGRKSIVEQKPETVELARKLARGRAKGGRRSLREISAALAEAGHVTKTGTPYAATAIKLMLDVKWIGNCASMRFRRAPKGREKHFELGPTIFIHTPRQPCCLFDPKRTCGRLALCLSVLTSGASIGTKQAMKRGKIQHVSGRVAAARPTVALVATAARNWQSQ
jgi:hypothetical protein